MVRVSVCSGRSNLGYSCRLLSIGIYFERGSFLWRPQSQDWSRNFSLEYHCPMKTSAIISPPLGNSIMNECQTKLPGHGMSGMINRMGITLGVFHGLGVRRDCWYQFSFLCG